MKRVELASIASAELDAAAARYESDHPGRGERFYAAVERSVRLVAAFPAAGPPFPRIPEQLGVRRLVVRGFPFVLAYRDLDDVIRVEAVVHTHRRPGYWLPRLK